MTLSEQHIEVISDRPLNGLLDHLQDKFRNVSAPDDGPRREDVAFALSILLGSPAAFSLTLPDGSNVATELLSVLQHVQGGEELDRFRPLIRHIVDKSQDEAIWTEVFNVIHGRQHVTLDGSNSAEMRVRLGRPIVRQKAIVSDTWKPEVETLKLAEERGVQGVGRIVAYRQITTIEELQEGLQFPERHWFRNEEVYFDDLALASTEMPASMKRSGQKRKSEPDHMSGNSSNPKRLRLSSVRSNESTAAGDGLSVDTTKSSLYSPGEDSGEKRISCLVFSPAGRAISSFNTVKELLESLRDAIKAHRSLYTRGNILHRDVSPNNIIITKPQTEDGFKGMLIDLDLAKVMDSDPSEAQHQTGTLQFMAIEVLRNVDHTYRHDLESFFYVLIWMCGRESWSKVFTFGELPPNGSRLRRWEIGDLMTISDSKAYHMTRDGIDLIMGEFPAALDIVKPLCLRIREILFPADAEGSVNLGTPAGDPDQLYRPIIKAYDATIGSL